MSTMRTMAWVGASVAALVVGTLAVAATPAATPASAGAKGVRLTGSFSWTGRPAKQDLRAVLTPDGTNGWKAVYEFTWDKRKHNYTGTVTGHLDNGEVQGEANADDARRSFSFKGQAKNGVITFDHFETTGGASRATGTGTLRKL